MSVFLFWTNAKDWFGVNRFQGSLFKTVHFLEQHLLLLFVLALYLLFSWKYLLEYPPVYTDEPWCLSAPINIVQHGRNALPMFCDDYNAALYYSYYLAMFLKIFGIGIRVGRAVSVAHGAGILLLVYVIARHLRANRHAWLAPALLVCLFPFTETSHYIRPDVIQTFFGLLAVWFYLLGQNGRHVWFVFAGIAAGISFGVFLVGVWSLALLATWSILDLRRIRAHLGKLTAGVLAGIIPFLIFIAKDPSRYGRFLHKFGTLSIFAERHMKTGIMLTLWDIVSREPQRYRSVYEWSSSKPYVLILLGLTLFAVLKSVGKRDWHILLLFVVPLATLGLFADNKWYGYMIVVMPTLAILVICALPEQWRVVSVMLFLSVALQYATVVYRRLSPIEYSYDAVIATYRAAYRFPPHSVVIGIPVTYAYYLGEPNVTFLSVHYFTSFDNFVLQDYATNQAKLAALARNRHVYLIFDEPSFFATMSQFDRSGDVMPCFRKFIKQHFEPIKRISLRRTPYGDFSNTIGRYVEQPLSSERSWKERSF